MRDTMSELWIQTRITISFRYDILCVLTVITRKLHVVDVLHSAWLLCYQRCIFSMLELDVRYDWQVMVPSTHRSLFLIINLCVLTYITWKLQVIYGHSAYWMTTLLSDTFVLCIKRCMSDQTGELWHQTRISRALIQHCGIYCKPIHSSLFVAQLQMTQQNQCTLWLHTTHHTTALLPATYHFIRALLTSYTTHCSVFELIVYARITSRYYYIHLFTSLLPSSKKKRNVN